MSKTFLSICLCVFAIQLSVAESTDEKLRQIEPLMNRIRSVITSHAVIPAADSLFALAKELKMPEYQCKALIYKLNYYNIVGDTLVSQTARMGIEIADRNKLDDIYFYIWKYLIKYHINAEQFLTVMSELEEYKTEARKRNSKTGLVHLHTLLGDLLYSQMRYSNAPNEYLRSDSLAHLAGLPHVRVYDNYMIGLCYREQRKFKQSLEYMRKTYNLATDKHINIPLQYINDINLELGLCYHEVSQPDSMQMCYEKFKNNVEQLSIPVKNTFYELKAYVMLHHGRYNEALAAADSINNELTNYKVHERIYRGKKDFHNAYLTLQKRNRLMQRIQNRSNSIRGRELLKMTTIAQKSIAKEVRREREALIVILLCLLTLLIALLTYTRSRQRYWKRLERQKEIAEKAQADAQRADRLKNDFISGLSNQITTPLNSIVGFAQVLGQTNVTPEERDTFAKIICDNSVRLKSLVNDILDMSNLTQHTYKVTLMQVVASDICMMAIAKVRNVLPNQTKVVFKGDLQHPNTTINTDIKRVRQVVESFMFVATDYTTDQSITLSYQINEADNSISYIVTGNSIDAPIESIDKILRGEISDDNNAHIMGLNICRIIAEYLYASCYVDKTYQKGLKLVFKLSLA